MTFHLRLATSLIAAALVNAPAWATPPSGVAPAPIANGHFGTLSVNTADDKTGHWGMILKTLDDTDVGVDRITIQPQGSTGWHAHPSPVFVTVTQGSIEWYDDALCTSHVYSAGQSFIEGAYRSHNVRNPATAGSPPAEFVAVVIRPVGFVGLAFRLDRSTPSSC
ncbi:cupin domain-containing protein [Sphingomonas ginkgonis]|uniref:Cupin domain-containing protein n=1 Tax=Sphingomonas ginkgonis TaxID=2315330 RepID=A0A3R9X7Z2_9SPHN|nr:cupin domain-containing protein [Sphingomonas ginkgonis]RST30892.1 cupin domain-containing protein [Sphingomonas ginkgonis]